MQKKRAKLIVFYEKKIWEKRGEEKGGRGMWTPKKEPTSAKPT